MQDFATRLAAARERLSSGPEPEERAAVFSGLPGLTREDILAAESRAGESVGFLEALIPDSLAKAIPFGRHAAHYSDRDSLRNSLAAIEGGTGTREDSLRALGELTDRARPRTTMGQVGGVLQESVLTGGELGIVGKAVGAGVRAAGAVAAGGSRLSMLAALQSRAGQALATTGGAATAREVVPRLVGSGGGAWKANAIERTMPEFGMTTDESGRLALWMESSFGDFIEADVPLWKGAVNDLIQLGSEMTGGVIMKAPVLRQLQAVQGQLVKKVIGDRFDGNVGQFLRAVAEGFKYQGPLAEFMEERVASAASAAVPGFEETWAEVFPDAEQAAVELIAFSLLGGAPVAAGATYAKGLDRREAAAKKTTTEALDEQAASAAPLKGGDTVSEGSAPTDPVQAEAQDPSTFQPLTPEQRAEDAAAYRTALRRTAGEGVSVPDVEVLEGPQTNEEYLLQRDAQRQGLDPTFVRYDESMADAPAFYNEGGRMVIASGHPKSNAYDAGIHEAMHAWAEQQGEEAIAELEAEVAAVDPDFLARVETWRGGNARVVGSEALEREEALTTGAQFLATLGRYIQTKQGSLDFAKAVTEKPGALTRTVESVQDFLGTMVPLLPISERAKANDRLRVLETALVTPGKGAELAKTFRDAFESIQPVFRAPLTREGRERLEEALPAPSRTKRQREKKDRGGKRAAAERREVERLRGLGARQRESLRAAGIDPLARATGGDVEAAEASARVEPEGLLGKGLTPRFAPAMWVNGTRPATVMSSSLPTGVKALEDPLDSHLVIGMDALRALPGQALIGKVARYLAKTPFVLNTQASYEAQIREFQDLVVENLLALHDAVPAEIRELARQWYDGANRVAREWARRFDLTTSQVSGVIAVLSPQKDWYQNVDLAERTMIALRENLDTVFDDGPMLSWARDAGRTKITGGKASRVVNLEEADIAELRGRTLRELLDTDLILAAKFIRAYDGAYLPRGYDIWTPDGRRLGRALKKDGGERAVSWGGYGDIAKAISVILDGSDANISDKLGGAHKVRSFYNNIAHPNGEWGDVTMDTHAVAAALWLPLSGAAAEVQANLSGTGVGGSSLVGVTGLYPVLADAYRDAAEARGILPREMQSITWEAVRGLFPATWKAQKKNVAAARSEWAAYNKGEVSRDEARQRILAIAGGIATPDWADGPGAGVAGAARSTADSPRVARNVARPGAVGRAGGLGARRDVPARSAAGDRGRAGGGDVRGDLGDLDTEGTRFGLGAEQHIRFAPTIVANIMAAPALDRAKLRGLIDEVRIRIQDDTIPLRSFTDLRTAVKRYRTKAPARVDKFHNDVLALLEPFLGSEAKYDDIDRLVYLQSAIERNAWMQAERGVTDGSGIATADAQAEIADIRRRLGATAVDTFLKGFADLNRQRLEHLAETRIITREAADKWHQREPHWVSMRDIDPEADEHTGFGGGRSVQVRNPQVRKAKGRGSEATDSLLAWYSETQARIMFAEKNRALLSGRELANDPNSGVDDIGKPKGVPGGFTPPPTHVAYVLDGEQRYLVFESEAAARALKGLNAEQTGFILSNLGKATRMFSRALTGRNPAFWLPNHLRDTSQAFWTISAERDIRSGAKVLGRSWGVLPHLIRYQWTGDATHLPMLERAKRAGFKVTWTGHNTLREKMLAMKDAIEGNKSLAAKIRTTLDWLEDTGDAFEMSTRYAAFEYEFERLRRRGYSEERAEAEAGDYARELTLNFDTKGTWTPALASMYAFFNPAMQGGARLAKAALSGPRGVAATGAVVAIGVMMEALGYAFGDEDELTGLNEYGSLAEWEKERNMVLPFKVAGSYVKITLPYGLGAVYGLGRRGLHFAAGGRVDPRYTRSRAVQESFFQIANEFNPIGDIEDPFSLATPTILRPLTELERNQKFGGRPIMKDKESFGRELPDSARAFSTIDDRLSGWLALRIANVLNLGGPEDLPTGLDVSPESIQHLLEFVGAGYGLRDVDRLSEFALSKREVAPAQTLPVLRNFSAAVTTHYVSEQYYKLRSKASTLRALTKDQENAATVARLREEDPKLWALKDTFGKIDYRLQKLGARLRSGELTKQQRTALRERMTEMQAIPVRAYYAP